ncbi:MAG: hypothetical protein MUF78_07195 [Candidatus Edwardsbacteria bacterium]|jgi:hypothetical protein|nr:hypothetical protein [Candidatus Edwardsbacteria bacterium]
MPETLKKALHWAPRVLGTLFPLFIALFAFDVLGHGMGFWRTALALLMHLAPSSALAAVLLVAWRWRLAGAVLYAAAGATFIILFHGRWRGDLLPYLLIAGPPLLTAALLVLDWKSGH